MEPEKQLRETENSSTLKFFVNVQNKTKLETNLQAASRLPHYDAFEVFAMRVVISDLPPRFPDDDKAPTIEDDLPVTGTADKGDGLLVLSQAGEVSIDHGEIDQNRTKVTAKFEITLARAMDLLNRTSASRSKSPILTLSRKSRRSTAHCLSGSCSTDT